jgi:His-Xaa-Ser system protein HxsD
VPVDIDLDLSVYPLEAVMGGAYVFIDQCYVFLDKLPDGKVRVSLTAKPGCDGEKLAGIAGDFRNELLSQALRHQVGLRHEKVRELLLARALFGAAPQLEHADDEAPDSGATGTTDADLWKALEELPGGDETFLDDPLGIAVSWEERFGRKAGSPVTAPPAGESSGPDAGAAAGAEATPARGEKDDGSR